MPKVVELRESHTGFELGPGKGTEAGAIHRAQAGSACKRRSGWVCPLASQQPDAGNPNSRSASGTELRAEPQPCPCPSPLGRRHVRQPSCPMCSEPALPAGRWRPARGHPRVRGTPARGWPGNTLRSRLRPLPAAARRGAGRADPLAGGGRRAARESGRREPKPAGACAPPAVRSRPRAGASARLVRNEGAAAGARRPAPPRAARPMHGAAAGR